MISGLSGIFKPSVSLTHVFPQYHFSQRLTVKNLFTRRKELNLNVKRPNKIMSLDNLKTHVDARLFWKIHW